MMEISGLFTIVHGCTFIYFIYAKQAPVAITAMGAVVTTLILTTNYFYRQLPPVDQWNEDKL